jgi:NhaP-type Na+/H+ or K+/H+ antiporter
MLASVLWILLMGFFSGQIARRLGVPPLIGMILVGIVLGPQVSDVLSPEVLKSADNLRIVAVMIILMKAGLGLDREKLALRLGVLPVAIEANAIAFAAMLIFKFDFPTGLLLGCVTYAKEPNFSKKFVFLN